VVRSEGLEPSRDCAHKALNLACLPFHHDREMVGPEGLEPSILRLRAGSVTRLALDPKVEPLERIELSHAHYQ
jgi:hypothetical protein